MSILDSKILQDVSTLPDVYKQTVIDLIASLKRSIGQVQPPAANRKIGSRKGVKFLAEGVNIDDYDDEISEMLGGLNK